MDLLLEFFIIKHAAIVSGADASRRRASSEQGLIKGFGDQGRLVLRRTGQDS